MNFIRKILFPFSFLYSTIASIRNYCYDIGLLKSATFNIPVIVVGNISSGGTGKTPQIEYLIRLLSDKYKVATLSRGYKRKSSGFILADANANAEIIGDEPYQYYSKFPTIQVAVDADRKNGIEQLLAQPNLPEVILLDDAFQHRKVKAGFYILLTAYNELYCDDFQLPTGNLRENSSGAKRANVIIVTKCPSDLSIQERNRISDKLKLSSNQELYFSFVDYDDFIYSEDKKMKVEEIKNNNKLLLAGIAKPEPFFNYLEKEGDICMAFNDHHHFTEKDIVSIGYQAIDKFVVTTEKDYVRLKGKLTGKQLFYLPIRSIFISASEKFDKTIFNFVESCKNQ